MFPVFIDLYPDSINPLDLTTGRALNLKVDLSNACPVPYFRQLKDWFGDPALLKKNQVSVLQEYYKNLTETVKTLKGVRRRPGGLRSIPLLPGRQPRRRAWVPYPASI